MMMESRVLTASLLAVLASGCAQSVSQTMGKALSSAPEWFDERREEVAGDGYPKFGEIPETPPAIGVGEQAKLDSEQAQLLAEAELLKNNPKALSPSESGHQDPSQWASEVRKELEEGAKDPQSGLVEETDLP